MSGLQMKYFVMKPAGRDAYARASRAGMRRYANAIVTENPDLAQNIMDWLAREDAAAVEDYIRENGDHD